MVWLCVGNNHCESPEVSVILKVHVSTTLFSGPQIVFAYLLLSSQRHWNCHPKKVSITCRKLFKPPLYYLTFTDLPIPSCVPTPSLIHYAIQTSPDGLNIFVFYTLYLHICSFYLDPFFNWQNPHLSFRAQLYKSYLLWETVLIR